MKKRNLFTVMAVVIIACAIGTGFFLLRKTQRPEVPTETEKSSYALADEAYFQAAKQPGVKLYESDIDGLFYSLSPVKFYRLKSGVPVETEPEETLHLAPEVAGTKMVLEVPYVQVGKELFGVGIWLSESGIYREAFAVLKHVPKGLCAGKYVLLLDTDNEDISATEREYSEIFSVSSSGECTYIFDQSNRTVESSGKLRTDWDVMSLSMLQPTNEGFYSLTGRRYHRDCEQQLYDLRLSANGSTQIVAERVFDRMFCVRENGVFYLRQSEEKSLLVSRRAGKETVLYTFPEALGEYAFSGNLAHVQSGDNALVSLITAREYAPLHAFKRMYAAAEQGNYIVCIGKEENRDGEAYKVQLIVTYNRSTEITKTIYANNIMDEGSSLMLCEEGIWTQKDGKSVFISYTSLEKLANDMVQ